MATNPDFAGLLIHTAVVYRRQEIDGKQKTNELGQPTRDEPEHHRLPVRFDTPKGGKRMEERSHDVVEVRGTLYLDQGADLREDDVVSVLGSGGEEKIVKALVDEVEGVDDGVGEHHREATLISQRQSR